MNSLFLMLGTLTVLPVRAPGRVDRRSAGWAMTSAPLGGALLALTLGVPLVLLERYDAAIGPLLTAALAVGALALLTRAIHLDGLADTADGLGSGREGAAALAIMRKSDIGPFGVVTLLAALLIQVAALAETFAAGRGLATLATGLVVSRAALPLLCTRFFRPAREDGLGRTVAGTVSPGQGAVALLLAGALTVALVVGFGAVTEPGPMAATGFALVVGAMAALIAAVALATHATRRFGGVTGDVYGACVEAAFTTVLVVAAVLA